MKITILCLSFFTLANTALSLDSLTSDYWRIDNEKAIVWDVHNESRLPHADDIEMAGQRVACILRYDVTPNRQLTINRDLIFPQLRRFVRTSEPDWFNYRNYLRYTFSDEYLPVMITNQMNSDASPGVELGPGESYSYGVYYSANER